MMNERSDCKGIPRQSTLEILEGLYLPAFTPPGLHIGQATYNCTALPGRGTSPSQVPHQQCWYSCIYR